MGICERLQISKWGMGHMTVESQHRFDDTNEIWKRTKGHSPKMNMSGYEITAEAAENTINT